MHFLKCCEMYEQSLHYLDIATPSLLFSLRCILVILQMGLTRKWFRNTCPNNTKDYV